MTRHDASLVLYELINSGIIDKELEQDLQDVANMICENGFEKCDSGECYDGDYCPYSEDYSDNNEDGSEYNESGRENT